MLRWMLLLALALAVTTEAATPGYSKEELELSRGKAAAAAAKHSLHRQAVAGMPQENKPLSAASRPGGSGGKVFDWQTMRMDIDKPDPYAREAMHAIDVFDPSEDPGNVGSGSGISHVNWWSGGKGTGKWWEHSKDHKDVATSLESGDSA